MSPKNDPADQPKRSTLFSAAEIRTMLEEFRELVREGVLQVTPENQVRSVHPPPNPDLQEQALNKVLERIERKWEQKQRQRQEEPPIQTGTLRQLVIERLAEQIRTRWESEQRGARRPSLREQVNEKRVRRCC